jgi:hypothetical protein
MATSNAVASTSTQNIVPVQAAFNTAGACLGLVGPGGAYFSPPLSGNAENPATLSIDGSLVISSVNPTVASGFGTSPTITGTNTAAFKVVVGTGGAAGGTITLPAAANGWVCQAFDVTAGTTLFLQQTGSTTTSISVTSFSITSGLAANMTAGDVILFMAMAY